MARISDLEHTFDHIGDVVANTIEIMENLQEDFDPEVCIIGAYWHDVGREELTKGHEERGAELLFAAMHDLGYDSAFIDKCVEAIRYHASASSPNTIEGWLVRDADKLGMLGIKRWETCLNNNFKLTSIVETLPELRDDVLHFEYSKKMYDREICKLVKLLFEYINK